LAEASAVSPPPPPPPEGKSEKNQTETDVKTRRRQDCKKKGRLTAQKFHSIPDNITNISPVRVRKLEFKKYI